MELRTIESSRKDRFEFDLAPGVHSLPVQILRKAGGRAQALWGLLAAVATPAFLVALHGVKGEPGVWVGFVVACGGSVLVSAATAIRALTLSTTWEFHTDRVSCRERWALRHKEWSEPLSAYRGVLAEAGARSKGKKRFGVHMLKLLHEGNKRRTVDLYCSKSAEGLRARQQYYAHLFGLPALVKTDDGYEERRPEDLGKSVRQRVADGAQSAAFDPAAQPPGRRLVVQLSGQTLTLRVQRRALGSVCLVLPAGLIACGAAVGAVAFVFSAPAGVGMVALALAGLGVLAGGGLSNISEELLVSPGTVAKCWRHPFGTFRRTSVASEEVKEVIVAAPFGKKGRTAVQVVTDDEILHFGRGLGRQAKRWVRDCVIAVISK